MKTSALARIYALAMSVLFASVATVGVAVLMSTSGEQARTELNTGAAARTDVQPANPELTHLRKKGPGSIIRSAPADLTPS